VFPGSGLRMDGCMDGCGAQTTSTLPVDSSPTRWPTRATRRSANARHKRRSSSSSSRRARLATGGGGANPGEYPTLGEEAARKPKPTSHGGGGGNKKEEEEEEGLRWRQRWGRVVRQAPTQGQGASIVVKRIDSKRKKRERRRGRGCKERGMLSEVPPPLVSLACLFRHRPASLLAIPPQARSLLLCPDCCLW